MARGMTVNGVSCTLVPTEGVGVAIMVTTSRLLPRDAWRRLVNNHFGADCRRTVLRIYEDRVNLTLRLQTAEGTTWRENAKEVISKIPLFLKVVGDIEAA